PRRPGRALLRPPDFPRTFPAGREGPPFRPGALPRAEEARAVGPSPGRVARTFSPLPEGREGGGGGAGGGGVFFSLPPGRLRSTFAVPGAGKVLAAAGLAAGRGFLSRDVALRSFSTSDSVSSRMPPSGRSGSRSGPIATRRRRRTPWPM